MKEIYKLIEFEQRDCYIFLDEILHKKDFSNYIFDYTSFSYTKYKNLTFDEYIFQNASFKKSKFFIFQNC